MHRRRRRPIERALFALPFLLSAASAQPAADAPGIANLDAFLSDVESLTADFRQELWTADRQLLQTETGTLSLKRPNRFRWNYVEPTELMVVADGEQVWMYDVELEQVTVAPLETNAESSPALLLSGDRAWRDSFDVVETSSVDGLDWVKLAPKTPGADFVSVMIGFDGTAPQRLELVDGLNQVTHIELANLALNPDLAEREFEFEPPPGVDVIGDRG